MHQFQQYFKLCVAALLAGMTLLVTAAEPSGGDIVFRYIDNNGVQVIHQSIPAEVVHRGYEIVSLTGNVLKVVPPAPQGADAKLLVEKMQRDAELAVWDAKLNRRYSEVRDIESAKERSLKELQGTLSLLLVNHEGIQIKIEKQEINIAIRERNAKPIAKIMLQNLASLEAEKKGLALQVTQRTKEMADIATSYNRDIERFRLIDK